uniref:Receptor-like serine/threonine-protein kinase n=1 Tax=Quercus lobata TaxID=97700 RepID=A0A7N2MDS0_QUELO
MDYKKNPWPMMLSFLFICLSLNNHLSLGADTISANQPLSGDQTISSNGGNFELGFFTPDGNLVLFNESQIPIWSTNLSSTSSGPLEAVLKDDGNFVLRHGSDNSSKLLWQSFDNPTDTWLPGAKMAYNNRTKQNMQLISWKNSEDPAPGLFALELQQNTSSYIILWNKSVPYWSSGRWNGKIFSLVPEMVANYIYNFSYVSNENESYFTYSVAHTSTISRFVMNISGQIQQLSWLESTKQWNLFWSQPRTTQCEVYAFCGPFGICNPQSMPFCNCLKYFQPTSDKSWNLSDFSAGCARKTSLQCGNDTLANGKRDKFWEMPNMKLPDHPQTVAVGSSSECESTCLNNCSCTAYAYGDRCSIWIGDLLNLQQLTSADTNRGTLYLKLAASELPSSKNSKAITAGVVLGSVAGIAIFAGLVAFVIFRRRRGAIGTAKAVEGSLVAFGYRDLQNATKNFSEKLGGGGFGSVFKGTLPDSTGIAVKKLESISQGEKQFRTEVSTIGTIQHVNLVRLRGFCSEGTKKLLVYDYMPNGSLDSRLFHEKNSGVLDWKTRYQIALGTARGLLYLHQKCRDCIIHCDIKPENILLDAELCPKVADFGLAKLVGRDFSRVLTTMRGTRGYLAPEWISGVAITIRKTGKKKFSQSYFSINESAHFIYNQSSLITTKTN